jgi:hypothetical protein
MHLPEPYRLFSAMLTRTVDQANELHHRLDTQNTQYCDIFRDQQTVEKWTLICVLVEAVFSGERKALLVGADDFSEKTDLHTRSALFLWADL